MVHTFAVSLIKLAFGLAGAGFLFAAVAASGPAMWLTADDPYVQTVRVFGLKIAAVCFSAGIALLWLRRGGLTFLDENKESTGDANVPFGGWLYALAVSLALTPFVLLPWLVPLGSLWDLTVEMLEEADFWGTIERSPEFSGLAIVPVLAVLLVPLAEAATEASFVLTSAVLLGLLAWRSRFFQRAFLLSVVLQAALVMIVFLVIDVDLPGALNRLFEPELGGMPGPEAARVRNWLALHERVATECAIALASGFGAYLIWLPALLLSRRVEGTFTRTPRWQSSFFRSGRDAQSGQASFRGDRHVVMRIDLDGKRYSSLEELPPEIRARIEQAMRVGPGSHVYQRFEDLPPEIRARFPEHGTKDGTAMFAIEPQSERPHDGINQPPGAFEIRNPSRPYEVRVSGRPFSAVALAVVTALFFAGVMACQVLGWL